MSLALVRGKNNLDGYIDKTGEFVIKAQFNDAESFRDGLAKITNQEGVSEYCGYINKTGEYAVQPKYSWIGNFHEGLALAQVKKYPDYYYFGYVDQTGKCVIEPNFSFPLSPDVRDEKIGCFSDGLVIINDDNLGLIFIDATGKTKIDLARLNLIAARSFSQEV